MHIYKKVSVSIKENKYFKFYYCEMESIYENLHLSNKLE